MNYDKENYKHSELTQEIISAAYEVYNYYGGMGGFAEKIYENALYFELTDRGIEVQKQQPINVFYKEGRLVGEFFADLVVENEVILELKSVSILDKLHEVQLVNYLRATPIEIGLLLNFGGAGKVDVKRKVFSNNYKLDQNRLPEM